MSAENYDNFDSIMSADRDLMRLDDFGAIMINSLSDCEIAMFGCSPSGEPPFIAPSHSALEEGRLDAFREAHNLGYEEHLRNVMRKGGGMPYPYIT